jgi:polyketide biosynthesis acyl carrier protein
MNKDHIYDVVKENMLQFVDGLSEGQIAPAKSLQDLGADSIAVVEIISACMRDLKLKVSRAELTTVKDVATLVDLLHEAAVERGNA